MDALHNAKVQANFDRAAPSWTENMDRDEYSGHLLVAILLERVLAAGVLTDPILDIGCGTGFCGPLIKRFATRLEGVDLSANMLAQAAKTGQYDALHHGEIVEFLRTHDGYGALTAAGVVYFFDRLEPLFRAARHALVPGGWFVFTTDTHAGAEDVVVSPRLDVMFQHRAEYVRSVAVTEGFDIVEFEVCTERRDHFQRQPVPALALALRRGAHD
jgi:predicted TPR repeat methyltransferase